MPKIIENIRERAIEEAGKELLENGYADLTIRRIAGKLGIGLGTIYNYFPSKEYLVASVMLEDWQKLAEEFEESHSGQPAPEVLAGLFGMVHDFSLRYAPAWKEYEEHGSSRSMIGRYHSRLVEQLSGWIRQALPSDQDMREPYLVNFLAEIILRFGSEPDCSYEMIEPAVVKLLRS